VGFFFYINGLQAACAVTIGSARERKGVQKRDYYDTLRQTVMDMPVLAFPDCLAGLYPAD
jgi:hypothetical protein